jgi:hypothetical protein
MMTASILRLALMGMLLAVATLCTSAAQANCGGCGGGKKECPAPSPSPSPAK